MGYGISESMGYGLEFPAYRHGSSKILWGMREYGLSGVWVIRVLTVGIVFILLLFLRFSYKYANSVFCDYESEVYVGVVLLIRLFSQKSNARFMRRD